jgi:DNA recombination protein RmuC
MPDWLIPALLALAVLVLAAIAWRIWTVDDLAQTEAVVDRSLERGLQRELARAVPPLLQASLAPATERLERELRDELARQTQGTRGDLGVFQRSLLAQSGEAVRTQNEQIDSFRTQLAAMQQQVSQALTAHAESTSSAQRLSSDAATAALQRQADAISLSLQRFSQSLAEQLRAVSDANDRRLAEMRQGVEARLAALQDGNEKKLEQMRATVDEKLQATLEQRLGESFRQVAERLDQVHRGLGEMQGLARDVGSLNRVLTNVKTRGAFGEVQLAALLEQVFTPDQIGRHVETIPGSGARVEFALKLPGRAGMADDSTHVWLPIDAKFPREDYERLLDAQERADAPAAEAAGRAIEQRLRLEARTIREKYLAAPFTTEFALLFVPTEGLYAEALRRPGLFEALQRDHRVTLAGPTTLLAMLNSLQMGFRTLALEKRSAEVWQVLGAVKTEFAKFGDVLAKTKRKLDEASSSIDAAQVRTRQMTRKLKSVEELPSDEAQALLPSPADDPAIGDDDPDAGGPG